MNNSVPNTGDKNNTPACNVFVQRSDRPDARPTVIDYTNHEHRVWLSKLCFWAFHNGVTITSGPTVDAVTFVENGARHAPSVKHSHTVASGGFQETRPGLLVNEQTGLRWPLARESELREALLSQVDLAKVEEAVLTKHAASQQVVDEAHMPSRGFNHDRVRDPVRHRGYEEGMYTREKPVRGPKKFSDRFGGK